VNTGSGVLSTLALGADGLSIGSPFIHAKECPVNEGYKGACIDYGADDIVVTTKLSGSRCTVINNDYVKKIGTDQNFVENFLNKNRQIKKYAKMLTFYKGMKLLEKAAFSATYKTVWCAGSSIEFTTKEESIADIVNRLMSELETAKANLNSRL
jgi:nitronate monooxygenase